MLTHHYHSRDSFELLPSIMIQRCMGHYFIYLAWGTESIELQF